MKVTAFLSGIVLAITTALSLPATATQVLSCKSTSLVSGWNGHETYDYVHLRAYIDSDTQLSKAQITGAFLSLDYDVLNADPDYRPRSPSYQNYNRFAALEDAWYWFRPLLPKNLTSSSDQFAGYIQISDEDGFKETIKLRCYVINR